MGGQLQPALAEVVAASAAADPSFDSGAGTNDTTGAALASAAGDGQRMGRLRSAASFGILVLTRIVFQNLSPIVAPAAPELGEELRAARPPAWLVDVYEGVAVAAVDVQVLLRPSPPPPAPAPSPRPPNPPPR